MTLKKMSFFSLLLITLSQPLLSQPISEKKILADSLFDQRQYTESFEVYEELFASEAQYSPQMLLKMAYIKEGLGDYAQAIWFLETYFKKTNDTEAISKIKNIVEQENLSGYGYDDFTYLTNLIEKEKTRLTYILIGLIILLFVHTVWTKSKYNRVAQLSLTLTILFCLSVLYVVNFRLSNQEGIILKENAFVMQEPSAAAGTATKVNEGDKIEIVNTGEIWTEVLIGEEKRFIRTSKIGLL